jgi:hypothetical protein
MGCHDMKFLRTSFVHGTFQLGFRHGYKVILSMKGQQLESTPGMKMNVF